MAGKPNSVCFKAYVGRAVFFIKERRIMFKTGDIIDGRYEIKEQIGAGGGGTVYKAYDKSMRMDVAIKLVKDLLLTSSELEVRTEVDLIKRLKHKYLPTVYNFVESDNAVYMVMEYIDGHDIKALSDMGRTFNEDTIIRCGIQICEALDELHSQKPPIIHGDIKPSNIMLTPADNICLIDFNISSVMKGNKAILHGYSKGYAAPEQTYTRNGYKQLVEKPVVDEYHEETRYLFDETAMSKTTMLDPAVISDGNAQGPAYIDVRTDIYGVGAVLYFMLTGYAPVGGNVDFTDIKVSKKLRNIILKAMAPQPYDRFMTAAEMKKALESDKPVAAPQRKKTAERTEKKMSADINLPDSEEKKLSPKTIRMCALSLCAVAVLFSVAIYGKNRADGDISVSQTDTSTESVTETASAETTVTTVTSTVSETTTETTKVTTTMGEHPIWPNTNAPKNTSVTTTTGEHPIWPNTNAPKNTAAQTAAPATAKTTAQTTVPTTAKTTAKTTVVTTVPTTVKTTAATTVPTTAKTTAKTAATTKANTASTSKPTSNKPSSSGSSSSKPSNNKYSSVPEGKKRLNADEFSIDVDESKISKITEDDDTISFYYNNYIYFSISKSTRWEKNKFITKEEISAVLFLSSEDESEDFNFNAEKSYTVKTNLDKYHCAYADVTVKENDNKCYGRKLYVLESMTRNVQFTIMTTVSQKSMEYRSIYTDDESKEIDEIIKSIRESK